MSDKPIEHTPTPWYTNGKLIVGATPEDGQIGGCHDVVDTEFVVLAANSYDSLIEACREAVVMIAYASGCGKPSSKATAVHTKLLAAIALPEVKKLRS